MEPKPASIFDLSPVENLTLVQALWDDIAANPANVPLQEWQRQEVERARANLDADPASGLSWGEVKSGIRARYGR